MLHWDGRSWTQVPSPDLAPFESNRFLGVAATSASNVWVVGAEQVPDGGQPHALIWRWSAGETWLPYPVPGDLGDSELTAVAVSPQGNAWAVGFTDGHSLTVHWDGHSWQD